MKQERYQVLLLAAGEGTRLRPLTLATPKCLAPISGKPLLTYWLELFKRGPAPSKLWVNKSYLADQVQGFIDAFSNINPSMKITTVFESNLRGTAGTLASLLPQLDPGGDLLLAHADNLTWFDLASFLKAHSQRPREAVLTMMTFTTDTPRECGVVELDENNMVVSFYEKVDHPPSKIANGAVYLISPDGLSQIAAMGAICDFSKEVIPAFIKKIYCWHNTVYHRDIGTPENYRKAQSEFESVIYKYGLEMS